MASRAEGEIVCLLAVLHQRSMPADLPQQLVEHRLGGGVSGRLGDRADLQEQVVYPSVGGRQDADLGGGAVGLDLVDPGLQLPGPLLDAVDPSAQLVLGPLGPLLDVEA